MLKIFLQNLGIAFSKFTREPALIGAAIAFLVSGVGNVYQYIDKRTQLVAAQQQHDAELAKTQAEVEKLKVEAAVLNGELKTRKESSEQRQGDIKQYRAEIKQIQADIASDDGYLLKYMVQKATEENQVKSYEAEQRPEMAQATRQNLQITLNEINRLEADKAERKARLEHLESLLNK